MDKVQECGCNPELVNAGFWYFGALIARSDGRLKEAVGSPGVFRRMLDQFLDPLRAVLSEYDRLSDHWRDP